MKRLAWKIVRIASVVVAAGSIIVATDGFGTKPLVVNSTDSMPKGLYARTIEPIRPGVVVLIPIPDVMAAYLSHWPEWLAWFQGGGLLKPIVGVSGDVICRDAEGTFTVNGRELGRAVADGPDGIPLPSWRGCQTLDNGQLAVFSDRILDSMDSREFGAVPAATAKTYKLIWKF